MQMKTCMNSTHNAFRTILATACLIGAAQPATAGSRLVYGVIRDFQASHVDFGLPSLSGAVHVAGNTDLTPDSAGDPVYFGTGAVVSTQWLAVNGLPLAPHMFYDDEQAVRLMSEPTVANNATMDSYDPSIGDYDVNSTGENPIILVGVPLPGIPAMPDLGASVGDVIYDGNSTTTISSSFLCDDLRVRNQFVLRISGNVTIGVQGTFEMYNYSKIELAPGAHLTLYVAGAIDLNEHAQLNANTADFTLVDIYYMGTTNVRMTQNTTFYGSLNAPNAIVELRNTADFLGRLSAAGLALSQFAGLHVAGVFPPSCHTIADAAGAWGSNNTGTIASPGSFRQWFKSIPGVNADAAYGLIMTDDGTGALMFESPDFTPIDNRLYGNEGEEHNRNFTYELTATFTHAMCIDSFFEFSGDGEVWVFINGELVIDLAGPQKGGLQHIDIDRLGLTAGNDYELKFFYAQRTPDAAAFKIRTNLDLKVNPATLSSLAVYD